MGLRHFALAIAAFSLPSLSPALGAVYYWDNNGATAGFGTAGGTWGSSSNWSTSGTGSIVPAVTSTGTGDDVNFGAGATGLGAGTVSVTGAAQGFKSMTFASGSGAITVSGGTLNLAAATSIQVDNATNTISSVLAGSGSALTKSGNGTLVLTAQNGLTASNGYTGGTTVNAGVLDLAGTGFVIRGALTINSGAQVNLTSGWALGFDSAGYGYVDNITINGGTLNQVFSGGGGTRTQVLNMTGGSITGSSIDYYNAAGAGLGDIAFNTNASASTATVSAPMNLRMRNGSNIGTLTFTVADGAADVDLLVSGAITRGGTLAGSQRITKSGAGKMVLSGANTNDGLFNINDGTLQFAKQVSLYNNNTGSWIRTNFNVFNATLAFNVGGTGEFTTGNVTTLLTNLADSFSTGGMRAGSNLGFDTTNASGGTFTIADVIANTGGTTGGARGVTKLGTGTLILTGTNTYTGATTISGGALQIGAGGTTGALSPSSAVTNNASLVFNRSNTITQGTNFGTISGTGSVTQIGPGTLILSSANTYTGLTTVSAGTLAYGASNVISTGAVTVNGGVLSLGAFSDTVGTVTLDGGQITSSTGVLTSTGTFEMKSGSASAILAGSGVALNKTTGGSVTLSGANTYTGLTTVSDGTLAYGASNVIGAGAVTVNGASAILSLGTFSDSVGTVTLDGSGQITSSTGVLTSTGTFEMKNGSASAVLGGSGVALNKTTSGVVTLTGANTYTGATTVSGGTLLVNGSLSAGGAAVTVANGATLGGSGTINRAVNIQAGGTLSPGNSPDQIFTGALTLAPLSIYEVEIFGPTVGNGVTGYDQTVVSGGVSLNGALLQIVTMSGVGVGDTFTIIDNDGADAVVGTFAGLAEGVEFVAGSFYVSITYAGGVNNNDVVLVINQIVPEPGSMTLCGLALLAGGGFVWRKRRRLS